jgi:hypothetical protein
VFDATKSVEEAGLASLAMIETLYPDTAASSSSFARTKLGVVSISNESILSAEATSILEWYIDRAHHDKDESIMPERPEGDEYWVGENPIEPGAGSWERWNVVGANFMVPEPPTYDSAIYKEAVNQVYQAASERSSEQGMKVNFWGGVPGTEAPAGIWLNRLYVITKGDNLNESEYAYVQKILAQTIADAFMECWKIKYTYWTKRPSMVRGDIQLAMDNPRFPSYVSGHSTISRAAAEVLSVLVPAHREVWLHDADEAKNSRLWAGIHFSYDNEIGARLGKEIGEFVAQKLELESI